MEIDCLIIDNFENKINEKLLYSILKPIETIENYVLINSALSLNQT